MSYLDHPSVMNKHPVILSCESIANHEPHTWIPAWEDPENDREDYFPPELLCGGLPRKIISIQDARSKRGGRGH